MTGGVGIASWGVVSAAGRGVDALWEALCAAAPLARPVRRYPVAGLNTSRAALLPEALDEALIQRWGGDWSRAERMALASVAQLGPLTPETGLVVATSLGNSAPWEGWHRSWLESVEPLPTPPPAVGHGGPAPRLARALGLAGPCWTVATACTSGPAALAAAADLLLLDECAQVVVVATDALGPFVHTGFDRLRALTPDDSPPHPFGAGRRGLWLGEGAAALLLRRWQLSDRPPPARLLGSGLAGDAVHMTAPDREGAGCRLAIRAALAEAGLRPSEIGWVSAHASGTPYNDAMEAGALTAIFDGAVPPVHAAKPVLGHTLAASGMLEAVIGLEVLRRGQRPPTASPGPLDPDLPPMPLDDRLRPLDPGPLLSLNSAFGGHNTALVIAPGAA